MSMNLKFVAPTLALALFTTAAQQAQADVILHAFNWRYVDVTARAAAIQSAGYKVVMVAPAYRSEGSAWWARYQPQDYRVIQHPLGDTTTFKAMITELNQPGFPYSTSENLALTLRISL